MSPEPQFSRKDYYLGGSQIGAWPIAISVMATQCSTNSILGAPAFVGFAPGGGMLWLQYELAVPLAMAVLILVIVPTMRQFQNVSIYSFLENRFDLSTRLLLSGLFLFVRAFATAVTVFRIALVIDLITGIGFFASVLILGVFTVVYDVFGGMKGVVYSDVIQMIILVGVLLLLSIFLIYDVGGFAQLWSQAPQERKQTLDFARHGLGDGNTFSFWPMLFGGLFLYVAYYGCDQSQAQRILSTASIKDSQRALFLNGILRFPLVALYCFIGLGLLVLTQNDPAFITRLPVHEGEPQFNLVVPLYILERLPSGVVGLGLVALFAAAMSSLDSVINSLSATTMDDFVRRFHRQPLNDHQELWYSRGITLLWGVITLSLAFAVDDIAPTVLEAINKIGSLANGPILAVFICGYFISRISGLAVKIGFVGGLVANIACWIWWDALSWLWWNVSGCVVSIILAWLVSIMMGNSSPIAKINIIISGQSQAIKLTVWFVCMMAILTIL